MKKLSLAERGRVREVARDAQNTRRRLARLAKKNDAVPEFMPDNTRQKTFVRAVAEYLAANQVKLQLKNPWAIEWSKVRGSSPLFGYPTVDEAEQQLITFLKGL